MLILMLWTKVPANESSTYRTFPWTKVLGFESFSYLLCYGCRLSSVGS